MMKSICALAHRPDRSRSAFQAYYEERHAPLAVQHFPFTRYVRNHLIGGDDIGFDTISEFWADDITKAAALMHGPVGDLLRADEERFMDRARIASGGVEELVLSMGNPAAPDGLRTAFLIAPSLAGKFLSSEAWRETVLGLGRSLASAMPGVSLDFVVPWGTPGFPATAVLWCPGEVAPIEPRHGLQVRRLIARRVETPAEQLLGNTAADKTDCDATDGR